MRETAPRTILHAPATATAPALTLRPWREGDLPALIEAYDDPLMVRSTQNPVRGEAGAVRWLEERSRGWTTGTRLSFAVFEEGRLAGHVVVKRPGPMAGASGASSASETAEVGYWTVAAARGRGVAPHAVETATVWAFTTLGSPVVNRLELLHQVDNRASCRVAEKAGYVYERTLAPHPPFRLEGHLHVRHR
ncbi:GNAT family N-acetyltransferase [Streptomyces sp. NBC_01317]|uniref:GNAT family N-acetyltransferase n=1 Tax=Streptomyces sp. NBC_01317 TaxID=2903822 RepID=UPI002E15F74E|nr:GNAT family N-acetyltransferase [Streptomyces sp. NBC_01317]